MRVLEGRRRLRLRLRLHDHRRRTRARLRLRGLHDHRRRPRARLRLRGLHDHRRRAGARLRLLRLHVHRRRARLRLRRVHLHRAAARIAATVIPTVIAVNLVATDDRHAAAVDGRRLLRGRAPIARVISIATALGDDDRRGPGIADARRLPVAIEPDPAALPSPVSLEPDRVRVGLAGARGDGHLRRRRSAGDDDLLRGRVGVRVVHRAPPLFGVFDGAAGGCDGQDHGREQSFAHLAFLFFVRSGEPAVVYGERAPRAAMIRRAAVAYSHGTLMEASARPGGGGAHSTPAAPVGARRAQAGASSAVTSRCSGVVTSKPDSSR